MIYLSLFFLLMAVVFAVLGFANMGVVTAPVGQALFFVFALLFGAMFVTGLFLKAPQKPEG